ncbi:protein asteroid homolog 1 [Periophthalmus magnuspinnatus]|uniref:protein asteroid homolog 1 n=1 Tax=Periophthalmus magnuspinnatus TaxID=409849 RepID=UPI00145B17E1|nr:protein asteroid homolog 1 [Periophthalmus magnuspinnatus]
MGVQGLTTFVEGNRHFLQDVKFRDSRLLIDGCSLFFYLYFNHGLDQQHGGDYDAFHCLLGQFLSALAACNIHPFVVLDGGMDPSDKKLNTLRQRLESKIKMADNISRSRHGSVLPLLTKEVFIQVLIQSGVPLVQCPSEADKEIACLARQWNCPVLSRDSDFYIFDLPGGYIPLNYFHWTNLNGKASQRYISARLYTTSALCRWFGGLNKDLLPLGAVLAGNDYDTPKEAELLSLIDANIAARCGKGGKGRAPVSRIEGLLAWLSSFSGPTKALAEISRLVEEDARSSAQVRDKKGVVRSKLWACMQEYNITTHSPLALWFSGRKEVPGGWTSVGLPECLAKSAAQGLLAASAVDALVMQRVLLMPQVENAKLASSHFSAICIRQSMYGILLHRFQTRLTEGKSNRVGKGQSAVRGYVDGCVSVDQTLPVRQKAAGVEVQGSPVFVEEYDRMALNLKKNQVEARQLKKPISLDTIDQASLADRLAVLLETLGVTESSLSLVPLHLRLAVAVTIFWQRESKPTPTQPQLHALLMGFVYGELNLQQCAGSKQTHERGLSVAVAQQRLRPGERRGLDLGDAHSYSQWQACLWAALCLNQVLLQPVPDPYLPWLFSGTLVHGLAKYFKEGHAPESLLHKYTSCEQLYSSLLDTVNRSVLKSHPVSSASGRRKRSGRGRKRGSARGRGAGRGNIATEEVNNRFAMLMSEEDDDDL